jgi:copper chaperone CopZ
MVKLQANFLLFIFSLGILVVFTVSSFMAGYFYAKSNIKNETTTITKQTIVDKINVNSFLVTRTVYIDQKTQINIDQGSSWSNFFWGQNIEAQALVRADIGIDLSQITNENIFIDNNNKTIRLKIYQAEILDINVDGDIAVRTRTGILRYLLENDPTRDHNLAKTQITDAAKNVIIQDKRLMDEAIIDAQNILQIIFEDTGYKIVLESEKEF